MENFDEKVMNLRDTPVANALKRIDLEEAKPKSQRAWYCGPGNSTSARKTVVFTEWMVEEAQLFIRDLQERIRTEQNPYQRNMLRCAEFCMCPPERLRERVKALRTGTKEERARAEQLDNIEDNRTFRENLHEIKYIMICRLMDKRKAIGISEDEYSGGSSSSSDEYDEDYNLLPPRRIPRPADASDSDDSEYVFGR